LVFDQQFAGNQLNASVWDTCYPWGALATGCTNFANPENEWYLPSQVQVTGSSLHLIARPESTEGATKTGQPAQYGCRSGMVTSYPGFQFQYGYVSFVAQLPTGTDLWSGLWLAAANLQWPPEIDVMESFGPPLGWAYGVYHPVNAPAVTARLSAVQFASLSTAWHTFGLLWTPQDLIWYFDNAPIMTVTAAVPHQMMYLIADLANYSAASQVGSCNGQLLIRSIDVWQNP
jgi:beta-glucanase (GH16 family)